MTKKKSMGFDMTFSKLIAWFFIQQKKNDIILIKNNGEKIQQGLNLIFPS
jgi:hypothetical protein